MTEANKIYQQSMIDWFNESELSTKMAESEFKHYNEQIGLMKSKVQLLVKQIKSNTKRLEIAKKEYSSWLKQVNKK